MATSPDQPGEYLTIPKAARLIGCAPRLVRAAIRAGELESYRLGDRWERVHRHELEAWVRSRIVQRADQDATRGAVAS